MTTTTTIEAARANCLRFARDHRLTFTERGTVGFGRPCVGFSDGGSYVDFNPLDASTYELIFPEDDRLEAPTGVRAYHKHNCFCVLAADDSESYDEAVLQLSAWVDHLESQGKLELVEFATGAVGIQAMFSGVRRKTFRFKDKEALGKAKA